MDRVDGSRGVAATSRRPRPGAPASGTPREALSRHRLAELLAVVALLLVAGLALLDAPPPVAW